MSVFHKKPITHINHVAIRVSNLERSLLFYQRILRMKILERTLTEVKLTVNGETALVTLLEITNSERPSVKTTGLYHFALLLPTRDHLAQFYQHLVDENIPFGASDHHVSEAIYIEDPDGNGIEVYADRPSDSWVWEHDQVTMITKRINVHDLLANKTKDWDVMPSETVLGHLHLHVNDLEEAKTFFTALGFSVINEFHGAVFMSAGQYHHHIAFNLWNGTNAVAPKKHHVGLQSFSIHYNDESVRKEAKTKLQRLNIQLTKDKDTFCITLSPYGEVYLEV